MSTFALPPGDGLGAESVRKVLQVPATPLEALPPSVSQFVPRTSGQRPPASAQSAQTPRDAAGKRYPAIARTVTPAGPMRRVLGRNTFHIITPRQ
ncbi:hypothetical protein T484DRAFT_1803738, partial [Baffinella frigidus]